MRAPLLVTLVVVGFATGCATARKQESAQAKTGASGADSGAAPGCSPVATLVPGGIADEARGLLYLRVQDGLEAVELASGATAWRTANARWPLAVSDQYLAAAGGVEDHPGSLRLSLHERGTGALLSFGPVVELGEDLSAEGIAVQSAFCGDGVIDLLWMDAKGKASGVRADLKERRVVGPPANIPASGASFRVGEAKVGELLLRSEEGQLRAFSPDGSLRWERPLAAERLSAR